MPKLVVFGDSFVSPWKTGQGPTWIKYKDIDAPKSFFSFNKKA